MWMDRDLLNEVLRNDVIVGNYVNREQSAKITFCFLVSWVGFCFLFCVL